MRSDITLQFITNAIGLILLGVREHMKMLPDFVADLFLVVGIILLIIGILGWFGIWDKLINRFKTQLVMSKLSPLQRVEHGKRPSTAFSLLWVLFFSLLLAVGLWQIYLWGTETVPIELGISTILVPIVYIILPTYNLVDIFFMKRKYFRLTHSSAIKDADFLIAGNVNKIFDDCYRILTVMNATSLKVKPLKLLKARLEKSKITVEVKPMRDLRVSVYVLSDTPYMMGKHDGGDNQKHIDTFTNMLYQSILELTN